MEKEEIEETGEQKNNRPWLYKKGQSGNPSGRPKGVKSMKQWIKERLEVMTDKEREIFLEGLSKDILWEMAEGKPHSQTDITSGGLPIPIINVLPNNSDNKDNEAIQKDKDSPGGDISE